MTRIGSRILRDLACGAALAALAAPVAAQQSSTPVAISISGGSLAGALTKLGRQARVQIVFAPERVKGRRAPALHGNLTIEDALQRLLAGTGLRFRRVNADTFAIDEGAEADVNVNERRLQDVKAEAGIAGNRSAVPEILVVGKKDWTLNLDIQRTKNDPQPYVVFTQEQIVRSGATNLDDFFRDYLGSNVTGSTTLQQRNSAGQSVINLRGFGARGTLILVDGRRYTQANTGEGELIQSSINGIPLDAIERVEVLASSASGIYGSDATGGVVNIILRHDYHGLEATAYYSNTSRWDASEGRLSLSGSTPLEHGKTRISFNASAQRTSALFAGDRDFTAAGRSFAILNDPSYLRRRAPFLGTTPNIASATGGNLTLKPQYAVGGVTDLGSSITFVPAGYRGITLDGAAALLANAGKQNLEISPVASIYPFGGVGGRAPLVSPSRSYSASATVRRDFTQWLNIYAEFDFSRFENPIQLDRAPTSFTLLASDAGNPFQQNINVTVPNPTRPAVETTVSRNMRALTGAILKLPGGWHVDLDLNFNWGRFSANSLPENGLDLATLNGIKNGTINILKDTMQFPISYGFLDDSFASYRKPSGSFTRSFTLKVAGPLPLIRFWGGKPILTALAEQTRNSFPGSIGVINSAYPNFPSSVNYTPPRSTRIDSGYGEIRIPVVGPENKVTLIRELEVQVAARYDGYKEVGANANIKCLPGGTVNRPLTPDEINTACPPAANPPVFVTSYSHSINPTVAIKWAPSRDIAFRGSYSTGYEPLYLTQLVKVESGCDILCRLLGFPPSSLIINVTDPLRGHEPIGFQFCGPRCGYSAVPGATGGNPKVDPQTSKSWSAGVIVTPRFTPGLRLSADWTQIVENNVYFSPQGLLFGGTSAIGQKRFDDYVAAHPERFTRGPASGGYTVGPITFMDMSLSNYSYLRSRAIDFAADYSSSVGKGRVDFTADGTYMLDLRSQVTPTSDPVVSTGVINSTFLSGGTFGGIGGLRLKMNGTIVYSRPRWSLGARVRYFGGYWLNEDHAVVAAQGSARIPAQAYFDAFGSLKLFRNSELRAGVNNLLDHKPPIDTTTSYFYSRFGDPKLRNFYVSIRQKF